MELNARPAAIPKRVKSVLVFFLIAIVGVVVWQAAQRREPEPAYRGKTLSSWLRGYVTSPYLAQECDEAVVQAGTNAFPTLLRLLRAKDAGLRARLIVLLQRQHIIKIELTPAAAWNAAASSAFWLLGTNAQTAVPALIQIADQNISPESQRSAIYSLAGIGPAAGAAVPSLLRWTTNADPMVRNTAKFSLFAIDPEAAAKAGITNTWPRFSRCQSDQQIDRRVTEAKARITSSVR